MKGKKLKTKTELIKKSDKVIVFPHKRNDNEIIKKSFKACVALTSGVFQSDKKELIGSIGNVIQSMAGKGAVKQFAEELDSYYSKGALEENFWENPAKINDFAEICMYLEKANDEKIIDIVKVVYIKSINKKTSADEKILYHQLLEIAKKLQSIDIMLLKSSYDKYISGKYKNSRTMGIRDWLNLISKELNFPIELIEFSEERLVKHKLISERNMSDLSGVTVKNTFRLRELGIKLCELLEENHLQK